MFKTVLKDFKIVPVIASTAAGTSDVVAAAGIDTTGFEGCCILAYMGAITTNGVQSLQAAQCATSGGSYADLAGSGVTILDSEGSKIAVLDIYRPTKPFIKPTVKRATQNSAINGVIAILYNTRVFPVTQSSTVAASKQLASPAEGTP